MNVCLGYRVNRVESPPTMHGDWQDPVWQSAESLEVNHFHPRSSAHRPRTRVRLLHDQRRLFVFFHVVDCYVRSRVQKPNGAVCQDSCVEFFVQPRRDRGYFNFEVNCGGWLHLSYVEDPTRLPDGSLTGHRLAPPDAIRAIEVYHSMPSLVWDEISEPCEWVVQLAIPLSVLERDTGSLGPLSNQTWQANFYKCADATSHPHWATWAPIGAECNFHQPWHFRPIHFV